MEHFRSEYDRILGVFRVYVFQVRLGTFSIYIKLSQIISKLSKNHSKLSFKNRPTKGKIFSINNSTFSKKKIHLLPSQKSLPANPQKPKGRQKMRSTRDVKNKLTMKIFHFPEKLNFQKCVGEWKSGWWKKYFFIFLVLNETK